MPLVPTPTANPRTPPGRAQPYVSPRSPPTTGWSHCDAQSNDQNQAASSPGRVLTDACAPTVGPGRTSAERTVANDVQAAPHANAARTNALGYAADSTYHLSFTVGHIGSSAQIRFEGRASQPLSRQSWGLDNVRVAVELNPY